MMNTHEYARVLHHPLELPSSGDVDSEVISYLSTETLPAPSKRMAYSSKPWHFLNDDGGDDDDDDPNVLFTSSALDSSLFLTNASPVVTGHSSSDVCQKPSIATADSSDTQVGFLSTGAPWCTSQLECWIKQQEAQILAMHTPSPAPCIDKGVGTVTVGEADESSVSALEEENGNGTDDALFVPSPHIVDMDTQKTTTCLTQQQAGGRWSFFDDNDTSCGDSSSSDSSDDDCASTTCDLGDDDFGETDSYELTIMETDDDDDGFSTHSIMSSTNEIHDEADDNNDDIIDPLTEEEEEILFSCGKNVQTLLRSPTASHPIVPPLRLPSSRPFIQQSPLSYQLVPRDFWRQSLVYYLTQAPSTDNWINTDALGQSWIPHWTISPKYHRLVPESYEMWSSLAVNTWHAPLNHHTILTLALTESDTVHRRAYNVVFHISRWVKVPQALARRQHALDNDCGLWWPKKCETYRHIYTVEEVSTRKLVCDKDEKQYDPHHPRHITLAQFRNYAREMMTTEEFMASVVAISAMKNGEQALSSRSSLHSPSTASTCSSNNVSMEIFPSPPLSPAPTPMDLVNVSMPSPPGFAPICSDSGERLHTSDTNDDKENIQPTITQSSHTSIALVPLPLISPIVYIQIPYHLYDYPSIDQLAGK